MNGALKTSLLHAIAATLGTATGRLQNISDLEWVGFNYELLANNWGGMTPEVAVQVQFSSDELQAFRVFQQKLREMGRDLHSPSEEHNVTLRWNKEGVVANSAAQLFQFKGREYAKQLRRNEGWKVFEQVGTVLWYTEQRTSTSLTSEDPNRQLEITEDLLRDSEALRRSAERMTKWRQFHQDIETLKIHQRPHGQKDLYAEIERTYKAVFPERSFLGPIPRENLDDILSEPWFYLYDGRKLIWLSYKVGLSNYSIS